MSDGYKLRMRYISHCVTVYVLEYLASYVRRVVNVGKQGFRSLLVWQKSRDLAVCIYKLTRQGNIARDYGFIDQIRRAAVSIPSNIAEGDERNSDKESAHFLYISKGSLAEVITQLEIAYQIGYITIDQWQMLDTECASIGRMLGALIKARSSKI